MSTPAPTPLLAPDEPPAVTVLNAEGRAPVLFLCDHASPRVPRSLDRPETGGFGVSAKDMERHIAYDIGAEAVTRILSEKFDAPAILSGYSRLVLDLNRALDDGTSIPPVSDGTKVPANQHLSAAARAARIDALYHPYHNAIVEMLDGLKARGTSPAIISMHSCTPVLAGFKRPWHIGVLWNEDGRIALPLMRALEAEGNLTVGDNEPYSGRDHDSHTIHRHAEARGLPHVLLEIRQDLISDAAGVTAWADRLTRVFRPILLGGQP
ncbi:N-formylglutamate amidohydrolase [Elstera sp.]|jgi:predicted N-formylglutamate amidohydrolase|uniref:N-formylglutamate amidohydrolase n=1 Tax=Elstera sp. TaxID=1916664 RepID=UPI0037BF0893